MEFSLFFGVENFTDFCYMNPLQNVFYKGVMKVHFFDRL